MQSAKLGFVAVQVALGSGGEPFVPALDLREEVQHFFELLPGSLSWTGRPRIASYW